MSRPPDGPPQEQRHKFIQWLIDKGVEISPIDKGGFHPIYHATSNNDIHVVKMLLNAGHLVRPNQACKNPVEVAKENGNRKLELLLMRKLLEEEQEKKRQKIERDKALARAAEHRRKLALKMEENAKELGGTGPKYKLSKLTAEETMAMARTAYEQAAKDQAAAQKRADEERGRQQDALKNKETKFGTWKRVGKMQYRFTPQGSADQEEETRTMVLAASLYEEITFGPREKKLRERWRDKTGVQKREPLPRLQAMEAPVRRRDKFGNPAPVLEYNERGQPRRREWLTFPGLAQNQLSSE